MKNPHMNVLTPLSLMLMVGVMTSFSPVAAADPAEQGFSIMESDTIGDLKYHMAASSVEKLLGPPESKGKNMEWEAIGEFVQDWKWPKMGITLQMVSATEKGRKKVFGITINPPSKLSTSKGIRIGSTVAAVRKAYGAYEDKEVTSADVFVAGTFYGGVIFSLKDGKVTDIFIGSAAE